MYCTWNYSPYWAQSLIPYLILSQLCTLYTGMIDLFHCSITAASIYSHRDVSTQLQACAIVPDHPCETVDLPHTSLKFRLNASTAPAASPAKTTDSPKKATEAKITSSCYYFGCVKCFRFSLWISWYSQSIWAHFNVHVCRAENRSILKNDMKCYGKILPTEFAT